MEIALRRLRAQAVRHTLFTASGLETALRRLPFVQADPIRSPARAQDLILGQRVEGYRVGDLDRAYPELDLEEGYLYAYGFLPRLVWQVRHPPNTSRLSALEKKVLARVNELGSVHPEALRAELGKARSVNAWGGHSTRVKLALESLHSRGLVRVARRQSGVRIYAPCPPLERVFTPREIFALVARTVVQVLAPAPERTVRSIVTRLSRRIAGISSPLKELEQLVASGLLERQVVSGLSYLWLGLGEPVAHAPLLLDAASGARVRSAPPPAGRGAPAQSAGPPRATTPRGLAQPTSLSAEDGERRVRFLAPFDPLVWDRLRFEQLWGWSYRFEAYTPAAKRVRGYYAMPLCWGDDVIGWANVDARASALASARSLEVDVELGFVGSKPRGRDFRVGLEREVERLRAFLLPRDGAALDAAGSGDPGSGDAVADGPAPPAPTRATPRGRPRAAMKQRGAPGESPAQLRRAAALRATAARGSSRPRASRRSRPPRS